MRRLERFQLALVLALALHGVVLVFGEHWGSDRTHTLVPLAVRPFKTQWVELDVTSSAHDGSPPGGAVAANGSATDMPRERGAGEGGRRGASSVFRAKSERSGAFRAESELSGAETPAVGGGALADSAAVAGGGAVQVAGSPVGRADGPTLSLSELGLTGGVRDAGVARLAAPADEASAAEARLEKSMVSAALDRDQELGLHSAGPVLTALRTSVARSVTAANSRAVFRATVGSDGKLVDLEVMESSSARAAWAEVTAAVKALLARQTLRVPNRGNGLSLVIEIVSREQMPSGADPGFGVRVAGVPLKEGQGAKSARIEILAPPRIVAQIVKIGETEIKVPTPVLPIARLAADAADIGASARRVVHVRLLRQRPL